MIYDFIWLGALDQSYSSVVVSSAHQELWYLTFHDDIALGCASLQMVLHICTFLESDYLVRHVLDWFNQFILQWNTIILLHCLRAKLSQGKVWESDWYCLVLGLNIIMYIQILRDQDAFLGGHCVFHIMITTHICYEDWFELGFSAARLRAISLRLVQFNPIIVVPSHVLRCHFLAEHKFFSLFLRPFQHALLSLKLLKLLATVIVMK